MAKLEEERDEVMRRLEVLRKGEAEPISKEEKDSIDAEVRRWAVVAKKRKKIHKELWDVCKESAGPLGKTLDDLQEELGVTGI